MTLNKSPVNWHEERLKNMNDYLKRKIEDLNRLTKEKDDLENKCLKLKRQINFAKDMNIEAFDEDEARMNNANIIGE